MKDGQKLVAKLLMQINAIKLNIATPFTWASGWKSPIYCDNRKILSYPEVRKVICQQFCDIIKEKYPQVDGIVGVATGAIAHGMLVAEALNLPFIYVRSGAKGHGLGNQIEGDYSIAKKYVVIEDLVSTGGSSLKAVEALREAKCEVLGMVAIFTYGFKNAQENFNANNCTLDTLSNYEVLINLALENGYIKPEQKEILQNWRISPENWSV